MVDGYVGSRGWCLVSGWSRLAACGAMQCVLGCQELGLSGSLKQTGVALGTLLGRIPSPSCSLDTAGDVKLIKACE